MKERERDGDSVAAAGRGYHHVVGGLHVQVLYVPFEIESVNSREFFFSPASFPSEPDYSSSSSYDPESAMEERALHVIRSCWKFSETNSVESGELWADPESMPTGGEFVVVDRVIPEFQVKWTGEDVVVVVARTSLLY